MENNSCRQSSYNNCGKFIEEDDEYCIFHKPNKSLIETDIFLEEIKQKSNLSNNKLFRRHVFNNELNFRGYVFPSNMKTHTFFSHSIFNDIVYFDEAVFNGEVDMSGIYCDKFCDFTSVKFNSNVYFNDSQFKDTISFLNTDFKYGTDFKDLSFKGLAIFDNSCFENTVNFEGGIFKSNVYFENAIFNDVSVFDYVYFKNNVKFINTTFSNDLFFRSTVFKSNVNFKSEDVEILRGAYFDKYIFRGIADFSGRQFINNLSFDLSDFKQAIILEKDFKNLEFNKFVLPNTEQNGYKLQKLVYKKSGDKELADEMFLKEMRAKRKKKIFNNKIKEQENNDFKLEKKKFKLLNWISYYSEKLLIDYTSKYGTSWESLIISSFVLILIFGIFYSLLPIKFTIGSLYFSREINFLEGLYFSVITFSTLGYGDLQPLGWARLLAGFQSLLGAFFVALFVVVFARKWMRN